MSKYFPFFLLILFFTGLYYKMFLLGKIPFPADLLVSSYSPWFDYYKLPIKNPVISDVFSQIFLWKSLSIEQIKNLQWPLWNPYSFTGNPLLANYQSAVFYPLNLLLFLPKHFGWGLFIFSQTLLASFGMYLFLSIFLNSKLARVFGAVTFALGGLNTTWVELGTAVHAISWLPFSLYFIEKFKLSFKYRYLLLLILSLTLTILSGFAQITIYTLFIVTIYGLLRMTAFKASGLHIILFISSIILSLGISAPQLLPSLDLLKESIRSNDSYIESMMFGLLPLKDLLKFFQADYFGNISTGNYWGALNYVENSLFLGTLNLPLLIFSFLFLRKTWIVNFFITLFIISLSLTFQNPVSFLIYKTKIPLLTLSSASRLLFITNFSAAVLCSFSLNQLIHLKEIRKIMRCLIWSLAALTGIALGTTIIYLLIDTIKYLAPNDSLRQFYLKQTDYSLTALVVSFRNQVIPFAQTILLILIVISVKLLKLNRKILVISLCLVIILGLDLGRYFLKVTPFVDSTLIFPQTPSLSYLQKQPGLFRVGRENAEVLPPNTWMAYNLQSFEGYDPIYLKNYSRYINYLNNGVLEESGYGRYAELTQKKYGSPQLSAINVKYIIGILRNKDGYPIKAEKTDKPEDYLNYLLRESPYKIVFHDRASAVLENPAALDRFYFAKSIVYADNQNKEQDIINNNFNPKDQVVLADNLGLTNVSGKGEIQIIDYQPNQIKLTTVTASDEILVLTDQYEKGWKAQIDGRVTPISRANITFRAIKIPPGEHTIAFYYWPESFKRGLEIFIASLILVAVFSIACILFRRVPPNPNPSTPL